MTCVIWWELRPLANTCIAPQTEAYAHPPTLRLLNALNSEDRGLKVRFSLATIVFETFELILCQMLSSQGKNAPSDPYPHYLLRLAASRHLTPRPVLTPMCVYGLTLYLVKSPSWGNVSGGCPSPFLFVPRNL